MTQWVFLLLYLPSMASPEQLDVTKLPERTIPTPKPDFFYSVPDSAQMEDGRKFSAIPKTYLYARLEKALSALEERIKVSTAKHLRDRQQGVLENISELRTRIASIFEAIAGDAIVDRAQLNEVCIKVKGALQIFKSDRKRNIDVGQKVSEIIFQIEKEVIQSLFNLPDKKEVTRPERRIDSPELLAATIDQLRNIVEAHIQVEGTLHGMKQQRGNFEEAWTVLRGDYDKVSALIDRFPDEDSFTDFPDDVKSAVTNWFKKYKAALETVSNFADAYNRLANLANSAGDLDRLGSAFKFYDGLMGMVEAPELQNGYRKLQELRPRFERAASVFKEAKKLIRELQEKIIAISYSEEIKSLAESVMNALPNGDKDNICAVFVDTVLEEDAAPEEAGTVMEGAVAPRDEIRQKWPPFYWKQVSIEEARAEARRRLSQSNPLVKYLIDGNDLENLKDFVSRLIIADLNKSGLSTSCFGLSESLYRTKEDLLTDIFPEIDGIAAPKITPTRRESRFRWVRKRITQDEIRYEAKSRLFFWPLVQELASKKNWAELRQLFDKIQFSDLRACGINESCIGGAQAPYKTPEDMLRDLFPEAFN